ATPAEEAKSKDQLPENIKAGEWVKLAAQILGGGGGGRDYFATAGGRDVLKIEEAIKEAISYAKGKI
ncbi:MAG: DHHA1 domain-containing protein, partial [Campylobacter sp.]